MPVFQKLPHLYIKKINPNRDLSCHSPYTVVKSEACVSNRYGVVNILIKNSYPSKNPNSHKAISLHPLYLYNHSVEVHDKFP